MKKPLRVTLIIVVSIVALALMWKYGFTVVSTSELEAIAESEEFDAAEYVDKIWSSRIVGTIEENAVDLSKILSEMETDASGNASKEKLTEIAQKYGLITVGEAHVYMVKGEGSITAVNTESSVGTIEVKVKGYDGPISVLIYIGTRIPSDNSSIRDAVGITFGEFKEQTQYGKVAAEINKRVLSEVVGPLDKANLLGKTIEFEGAMTIRTFNLVNIDLSKVTIVPVKIVVKE